MTVFDKLDKVKPFYDLTHKIVMLLCKVLLVVDIVIASVAVIGRFVPFIPDPSWSEEVVLTCMSYMAVLSASMALRTNSHIRMTALDRKLPVKMVMTLDVMADIAIMIFAVVMIKEGWTFCVGLGAKGSYTSIPWLSKFWLYFPIPLAGIAMIVFELETLYNHIKKFFVKEEA